MEGTWQTIIIIGREYSIVSKHSIVTVIRQVTQCIWIPSRATCHAWILHAIAQYSKITVQLHKANWACSCTIISIVAMNSMNITCQGDWELGIAQCTVRWLALSIQQAEDSQTQCLFMHGSVTWCHNAKIHFLVSPAHLRKPLVITCAITQI